LGVSGSSTPTTSATPAAPSAYSASSLRLLLLPLLPQPRPPLNLSYGGTFRLITGGPEVDRWIPEASGISADLQQMCMDMLLMKTLKAYEPSLASSYESILTPV
jgi:hypothetical protein